MFLNNLIHRDNTLEEMGMSPSDFEGVATAEEPEAPVEKSEEPEEPEQPEEPKSEEPEEPEQGKKTEPEEEDGTGFEFSDPKEPKKEEPKETKETTDKETKVDHNAILGEMSEGKIKSTEDFKNALNELETLRAQHEEGGYKNPITKEFDQYLSKGGDPATFGKYLTIDVDGLSDKDALIMQEEWSANGLDQDEIDFTLKNKYHLYDEDDDLYDEIQATAGRIQMKKDAINAKKELKEQQGKLKNLDVQKERKEETSAEQREQAEKDKLAQQKKNLENWQPHVKRMADEFNKLSIALSDGVNFNYDIKTSKDQLTKQLFGIVQSQGLEPNDQGMETVKSILENTYFLQNKTEIINSIARKVRTLKDDQWRKFIHRPSEATDKEEPAPEQKSYDDMVLEAAEQHYR